MLPLIRSAGRVTTTMIHSSSHIILPESTDFLSLEMGKKTHDFRGGEENDIYFQNVCTYVHKKYSTVIFLNCRQDNHRQKTNMY